MEDICRAFGNIVDNFKPGEVYNLGGETQYEIKYVSDLILRYLRQGRFESQYKKEEAFTTRIKTPDSAKARRDLDLRLTVAPEEGIPRTIEWFKKHMV